MLCVAQPHEHAVKYESSSASLLVYYDYVQDHEAGVTIEKIPNPGGIEWRPFELWEVLRSQNSPEGGTSGYLRLEDLLRLSLALERLAKLTKDWAEKLLDGDPEEFARLAEFRRCETLKYNARWTKPGASTR